MLKSPILLQRRAASAPPRSCSAERQVRRRLAAPAGLVAQLALLCCLKPCSRAEERLWTPPAAETGDFRVRPAWRGPVGGTCAPQTVVDRF